MKENLTVGPMENMRLEADEEREIVEEKVTEKVENSRSIIFFLTTKIFQII